MFKDLLIEKINEYAPKNDMEQELALLEIMQQYVLVSLSKHGFFEQAQFHGGTCLKIIYHLKRFSEDLDFVLKKDDPQFHWQFILEKVKKDMEIEGVEFEILDPRDRDFPFTFFEYI